MQHDAQPLYLFGDRTLTANLAQTTLTDHRPVIVLADGDTEMCAHIERSLGDRYYVVAVADGKAALEAVRKYTPDLVLADAMVPELGGFGLLYALRADERTRYIPVVMLWAREATHNKESEAEPDDYLVKPFAPRELLARVESHLRLQRVRRDAQAALHASEEKFATAFNRSPLALTITSLDDGRLVDVNDGFVRLSGYTRQEALGRTPDQLKLWVNPGQRFEGLERLRAGEHISDVEIGFRTKSGEIRTGMIGAALLDINGRPHILSSVADITGRKQAEEALRESEARARLAIEVAQLGTWRYDPEIDFVHLDERMRAIWGELPETTHVSLPSVLARIHPDDRAWVTDKVDAALGPTSVGRYDLEYRIIWPDGTARWVLANGQIQFAGEGTQRRLTHFMGTALDITERKRTEQRLQQIQSVTAQLAQTQTIADVRRIILHEVVSALQADGGGLRLVGEHGLVLSERELGAYMSQETVQPVGFLSFQTLHPAVEAAQSGKAIFIQDAQESIARYPNLVELVMEHHTQANAHVPLGRGDQVFAVLSLNFSKPNAWDEADRIFTLALADRSAVAYERARLFEAERRTRERIERLQALTAALSSALTPSQVYEAILHHIIGVLSPGNEKDILGTQTAALYILSGETLVRAARVGVETSLTEVYQQFPLAAPLPIAEAVRSTKPVWITSKADFIAQYPHLEDQINQLDSEAAVSMPIAVESRVLGGLNITFSEPQVFGEGERGFLLALTTLVAQALERSRLFEAERAATEREQILRLKAEEASRLKDEFLATVSHELRTPLTSILGYAQLLQTRKRDEAYIARILERMVQSARVQGQIIEDLLDVSRIVNGKLHLEMRPTSLISIAKSALETVRPTLEAKGLRVELNLLPEASMILGDANRLQQVLWNLLTNAAKFTPSGGVISIGLERRGQDAQLTVSDTGRGISASFLPFVFDRFRQADSASTRSYGGLGLGLAIVRHLVELHGGTVEVASAGESQGAAFTVRLPLLAVELDDAESEANDQGDTGLDCPPELRGLRVLIVDDQHDILELLYDILEPCGVFAKLCNTPGEALDAVQTWQPDLLISDIAMPQQDGYWLIRKVRALEARLGGRIPAIALTAYVRAEERIRVLTAGFQHYIAKPVEPGELRAVVASLARIASDE